MSEERKVLMEILAFSAKVGEIAEMLNQVDDEARRQAHLRAFITTLTWKMCGKKSKAIEVLKEIIKHLEEHPDEEYVEDNEERLALVILLPEEDEVNGTYVR